MVSTGKMLAFINALGGGSSPSEVVILPETVLAVDEVIEGNGVYALLTPPENAPTSGAKCKLMWSGTEYTNTAVDVSATMGIPVFLLGNTELFAEEGISSDNPDADAPYCIMLVPGGMPLGDSGLVAYGMMMSMGITPDPPVLSISIVQVGAASGGASDSPVFVVKVSNSGGYTADKTYDETLAAMRAGKLVYFIVTAEGLIAATSLVSYFMDKIFATFDQTLNNQKLEWSADGSLKLKT